MRNEVLDIFGIARTQLEGNDAASTGLENRRFLESKGLDDSHDTAADWAGFRTVFFATELPEFPRRS